MINAFEAAALSENYELIDKWKKRIEQTIMEHIESGSGIRSVSLCCTKEDNDVIDLYIIPWLSNLRYKAFRDIGVSGLYNNLVIKW